MRNTNSYGLNPVVVETKVFIAKQQEVTKRGHSLPLSLRCLVIRLLMVCMYLSVLRLPWLYGEMHFTSILMHLRHSA